MNINWEYMLSTYTKIYHEGYISKIFVRNTYTTNREPLSLIENNQMAPNVYKTM